MQRRLLLLLALALLASTACAATTANSAVTPQTPQVSSVEIVSGTGQCTAAGQPFTCCTGSGAGTNCNTTAASTDAAPTWTSVYVGGSNGSKVVALTVVTTDATAHVVTCCLNKQLTSKGGGHASCVAVATGTTTPGFANGAGALNLLSATNWPGLPVDSDGNAFLYLANTNDKLDCRYATSLSSGKLIGITAIGADF